MKWVKLRALESRAGQFRPAVDGRMEGIDEMWMRSEPRWPYKVPVLGEAYSMYAGWARGEERAADRDTLHAAGRHLGPPEDTKTQKNGFWLSPE